MVASMRPQHGAGKQMAVARRRAVLVASTMVGCFLCVVGPKWESCLARRSSRSFSHTAFVPGAPLASAAVVVPALNQLEQNGVVADLPQLSLAQLLENQLNTMGPDAMFYGGGFVIAAIIYFFCWSGSREFFWRKDIDSKVNEVKLKLITREDESTALDKYLLGGYYIKLKDYPAALAEYDEAEDELTNIAEVLDQEDTMGALATRAMLHNSKGFALVQLEPPKLAQARREFVRAVTFWPEYPEALLNISRELMKRKRYDVAVRTLNTALKWKPGWNLLHEEYTMAEEALEAQLEADSDSEDEDETINKEGAKFLQGR